MNLSDRKNFAHIEIRKYCIYKRHGSLQVTRYFKGEELFI